MKAIILASAETVKLPQILEADSFATIPLANKALLAHTLEQLKQAGATQAIITAERPDGGINRLWNENKPPLPLRFTNSKSPVYGSAAGSVTSGTANAIKRLKNELSETFLIAKAQHLVTVDLKAALENHRQSGTLATVVKIRVSNSVAAPLKAVSKVAGNSAPYKEAGTTLIDSPSSESDFNFYLTTPEVCFDSGFYILEPKVLEQIPDDKQLGLDDFLAGLTIEGYKVNTYINDGQMYNLNALNLYWQANMDILAGKAGSNIPLANMVEYKPGIWVGPNTKIHHSAKLQAPLVIGANVKIDQDVKLENSVLGNSVELGQGAKISNSVIFPQTKVGLAVPLVNSLARNSLLCQGPDFETEFISDPYTLTTVKKFKSGHFFRRAFNFLTALVGLIIISPILLLCAIAIKLDSPGPIMYKQLRVGEGRPGGRNLRSGRVFKIYKFRTMYTDADERLAGLMAQNEYKDKAFIKIKNDPRITRIGNFLRKTSLDELPQLINVVLGDMQLVGNRPLPVYEAEALGEEWQKLRFNAPAGITGLWQISGRSNLTQEERLVLDNYYAVTYSFWGDIKILLITPFALIKNKGAR